LDNPEDIARHRAPFEGNEASLANRGLFSKIISNGIGEGPADRKRYRNLNIYLLCAFSHQ